MPQVRSALSVVRPTLSFSLPVLRCRALAPAPNSRPAFRKIHSARHLSTSSQLIFAPSTSPTPKSLSSLPTNRACSKPLASGTSIRFSSTATPRTEHVPPPDPTASYAAPITSSQDPNQPPSSPPPSSALGSNNQNQLTWNAFLALRRTRRRYNLVSSIFSSLATTSAGITILARQNIEAAGVFGLDPFIVLGMATAGSGAVGWLVGPFIGNAVFGWVHRGLKDEIAEKEKDLYRRIKRHRVDPSSSSAGNPVPDYYGEKIGSVADYRTWLKDQRAYNKRRQTFIQFS